MGAIVILDGDGNSIDIDCTNEDSRNYSSKVTSKPIGSGISVSDSRVLENPKFSIDGTISNIPTIETSDEDVEVKADNGIINKISLLFGKTTSNSSIKIKENVEENRVLDAHKYFENLYESQKTFSLFIRGFDEIDNLVLLNYTPKFNADNGDSLKFTLEIQKIIKVKTKTTSVPKEKVKPKVVEKKNNGKNETKKIDPNDTYGVKVFDGLKNVSSNVSSFLGFK
ncbi:phage baseplate protein [Silvanigrella sp.]|jgi:hypothetical protein|uniref:phage baseplate protein n=1 Tax=Silvanigrella sp. TaxID=2024976 RepID=UPI0037CC2539